MKRGVVFNEDYPALADRMDVAMRNTPLPQSHNSWVFYACVLFGIQRRRRLSPAVTAQNAEALCALLVQKVRETS